jgi:heme exporter protein B
MAARLWWIIHKDLVSEYRARRAWPAMLLLGAVVVMLLAMQTDVAMELRQRFAGGLIWLAVLFAGMQAFDRSFACEREEGCWESLVLYPVTGATIYLAKLVVNALALAAIECLLFPLFAVLADVPLWTHPWALLLVAVVGNVGLAAEATLLCMLTAGTRHRAGFSALLVLPMAVPVILGAAEATRLAACGDLGPAWWRWVQLLGVFAVIFITAGVVLFDCVTEE